jgi:thiol:disulfide interchange protein DsbC
MILRSRVVDVTKSVLLGLVGLLSVLSIVSSDAIAGKKGLTNEDARKVLETFVPGIKVISVTESPIKGLYEVIIEIGGKKSIVYLDQEKKNLVLGGQIVDVISKRNITKEKFDEINRVDFSQIPLDDALVLGSPDAKYKVAVFDDPD